MKNLKKINSALLAALLCVCLLCTLFVSCSGKKEPAETTGADTTGTDTTAQPDEKKTGDEQSTATPDISPDLGMDVKVTVLNGSTGFGMSWLMEQNKQKKTQLNYQISTESDASNVSAALISGSVDIAALPTNAAATVYTKTNGGIQVLAANTLGVLYVVTNGDLGINSLADLEGKTVYCPAQNPSFIMQYLFTKNNLHVTIDNSFAQPAALQSMVAAGQADIAVLPEPMVSIAMSKNANLKVALDVTEEWNRVSTENSLVQGCIVVRTEFAAAHPDAVAMFLQEYSESVAYVNQNPADAANLILSNGIAANVDASVIASALPNANICFMEGDAMKTAISGYLRALFDIMPSSIGGSLPADSFYYARQK